MLAPRNIFFQIVSSVKSGRAAMKCDKRMTGSTIIDDVLHEVRKFCHFVGGFALAMQRRRPRSLFRAMLITEQDSEKGGKGALASAQLSFEKDQKPSCSLQILDYVYRDYIQAWYKRISDDNEFHYDMRMTIQRIIIAISERCVFPSKNQLQFFAKIELRFHQTCEDCFSWLRVNLNNHVFWCL